MSDTGGSPGGAGDNEPGASQGYGGNHRDTDQKQDPSDRNRYRRRQRRRRLPARFADFKLADGRTLREVLGDRFFGAAQAGGGKWMSKGVRERLMNDDRRRPIGPGWHRQGTEPDEAGNPSSRTERLRQRAERRRAAADTRRAELRERVGQWRANRPGPRLSGGGGS